jgi:hypothetical protein
MCENKTCEPQQYVTLLPNCLMRGSGTGSIIKKNLAHEEGIMKEYTITTLLFRRVHIM